MDITVRDSFSSKHLYIITALFIVTLSHNSHSSLTFFTGNYANDTEENAAIATQSTYNLLKSQGCTDAQVSATSSCSGLKFVTWKNVREIVHTANDLCPAATPGCGGSTTFSLQTDLTKLGFALRWVATEENSTQEDLANSFVAGQLTSLGGRSSALRSGTQGFSIAMLNPKTSAYKQFADNSTKQEPRASDNWSPWGGFLNINYTYGNSEANERENAYDFDGTGFNAGIDYRINYKWVIGVTAAYASETITFDASKSIVRGDITMNAISVMPFVLFMQENWFAMGSMSLQQASYDMSRYIQYGTNNPLSSATDTVAKSTTDASIYSLHISSGYTWLPSFAPKLGIEPSLALDYQNTTIDGYTEQDIKDDGFNFIVDEQTIDSLQTSMGLKVNYTLSSSMAVVIPFIQGQWFIQHEDEERIISASYAAIGTNISNDDKFQLTTTPPERSYAMYTLGASFVLRGSQKTNRNNQATGGLQGVIRYSTVAGIEGYTQSIISGGLRYEF